MRASLKKVVVSTFVVPLLIDIAPAQTNSTLGLNGPSIHGIPPSVTSFNFGGSPGFHGVPPSVTSLNFGDVPRFSSFRVHTGPIIGRHRRNGFVNPFFGNVVAVPYAYPVYVVEPAVDDSMEADDYRGGPTIFDRRGAGYSDYARPGRRPREYEQEDYRHEEQAEPQAAHQQEVPEQPRTVLVFKDGHQQEISNYAIVGSVLYDLSEGKTHRVALNELDLTSTVKQNDSRGVDFQLPAAVRAN
jgi:hypothetical protein